MTTYTGSALAATVTRNLTSAGTFAAQTWYVSCPRSVKFTSFVVDIFTAGNYDLKIDGVTVASVSGVTASQTGVTFTPTAAVELAAGQHTFQLTRGVASRFFYKGTGSYTDITGTGAGYIGLGAWQEGGSPLLVPGTINFIPADGSLISTFAPVTVSNSIYASQTWTVTFDTDVMFYGMIKRLTTSDTGYTLKIDGVSVSSAQAKTESVPMPLGLGCSSPVHLSAGAHTFSLVPTAANRRFWYSPGTSSLPTGDSHTTGWGQWAEATGTQPDGILFYELYSSSQKAGWEMILN